jgi:SNF2 family DNA or RNA helicase
MGQVRPVDVHRLLAEDTVDQRMLEMLAAKAVTAERYPAATSQISTIRYNW